MVQRMEFSNSVVDNAKLLTGADLADVPTHIMWHVRSRSVITQQYILQVSKLLLPTRLHIHTPATGVSASRQYSISLRPSALPHRPQNRPQMPTDRLIYLLFVYRERVPNPLLYLLT